MRKVLGWWGRPCWLLCTGYLKCSEGRSMKLHVSPSPYSQLYLGLQAASIVFELWSLRILGSRVDEWMDLPSFHFISFSRGLRVQKRKGKNRCLGCLRLREAEDQNKPMIYKLFTMIGMSAIEFVILRMCLLTISSIMVLGSKELRLRSDRQLSTRFWLRSCCLFLLKTPIFLLKIDV